MDYTGLHFFAGYSLVDITPTGVIRGQGNNELARNQQRNWETTLQCLGLRTQPQHIQTPIQAEVDLESMEFGDFYTGKHQVWSWIWAAERSEVYDMLNKPMGGLQSDFEQVPIITYLNESARFMLPIFYPYGSIKNIYFKQIKTS
jgi:hypothetical protein